MVLCDRTIDDLSDVEVISRIEDDLWFANLCIEELRRLPSEVEIGMREYSVLQARAVIKDAQARLTRHWADAQAPGV